VILAGGQGTRFWPISRISKPKQFLTLSQGGESLIQATARRVAELTDKQGLFVVTAASYAELAKQHVPAATVLAEPEARNTAASIGLAALHLKRSDPKAVMIVLPADHNVHDEKGLQGALSEAAKIASQRPVLVTIGIKPTFPHTGYGYMRKGSSLSGHAYQVTRFYEKPNLERARMYVESGEYFWNSGMFIWGVDTILAALAEHMPDLHRGLMEIDAKIGSKSEQETINKVFAGLESVSIDFGVLEHAKNCSLVIAPDFGWSDVGSWDAWADHFSPDKHGNVALGDTLLFDSTGCVVHSEKRLVALLGARDMVVIDSGDALLVCPRRRVQDVKQIVDALRKKGRTDLI